MTAKNTAEIESMRKGGKILGAILHTLASELEPGMSTMDLERRAEILFKQHKVKPGFKGYHGFPFILCSSVNSVAVHAFPNETPMEKGDILSIDCGVILDDLNTDSAIACVVGGQTDPEIQKFVNTCIKATWAGINQCKAENHLGDIGHAVEQVITGAGYNVIKELTGHGIGYKLHEEPYVYNFGNQGAGMKLIPGMTLAIEPIVCMGNPKIKTLDDDWTIIMADGQLALQHEHTILVTEDGVEVLTLRPGEVANLR